MSIDFYMFCISCCVVVHVTISSKLNNGSEITVVMWAICLEYGWCCQCDECGGLVWFDVSRSVVLLIFRGR